ncbi:MAG: hypothetical protein OET16_10535, partial [Chromatiales bacterium]|nr:hypothetical protein [Chromatiales bacterium]
KRSKIRAMDASCCFDGQRLSWERRFFGAGVTGLLPAREEGPPEGVIFTVISLPYEERSPGVTKL